MAGGDVDMTIIGFAAGGGGGEDAAVGRGSPVETGIAGGGRGCLGAGGGVDEPKDYNPLPTGGKCVMRRRPFVKTRG